VGYQDAYTYNRLLNRLLGVEVLPTRALIPTEEPTELPTEIPTGPVEEATATVEGAVPAATTPAAEVTLPTDTPVPTDTPAPTNTPAPTDTPTRTPTNTRTPTPTPTATPEPITLGIVTADQAINVRVAPNDAVVGVLEPGEQVVIIGQNEAGDWYNIMQPNGTPGWVAAFLLRVEIVTPTPVPVEPTPTREDSAMRESKPQDFAKASTLREQEQETTPTPSPTFEPTATTSFLTVPGDDGRMMAVITYDEGQYRDERWYSYTIGIIVAAVVIAFGNLFNILRFLFRRRPRREQ
jgi:type VI secretion system secreted protein VgrG